MIQTESPHFQYAGATESPGPFNTTDDVFFNDPTFPDDADTCIGDDLACNFSWAVMISQATNLTVAGAGLYSWFDAYDQSVCVDAQNCQQRLINDQGGNIGLYIWNLITIGSVEMISDTTHDNADTVFAANNTQLDSHPFWSALAAYADDSDPEIIGCTDNDTSNECNIDADCNEDLEFDTLDNIQWASGNATIEDVCISCYALQTLSNMIDTQIADYNDVNTGYDGLFKYYIEYIKNFVPYALTQFMAIPTDTTDAGGEGQQYFDCTYESKKTSYTQACPISVSKAGRLNPNLKNIAPCIFTC